MRPRLLLATGSVGILALAGCASSPGGATSDDNADGRLQIVASTNVYGDIAENIAGDLADVTSIITSAAQDPHSYEASAQDQLALSRADLVIENGGGYDPFIDTLLDGSANDSVTVLNASEASGLLEGDGHDHEEGEADAGGEDGHDHIEGFNEHVWYSFHAVDEIAHELAHELGDLDEANAAAYEANYEAFAAKLDELHDRAHAMEPRTAGLSAAITEPVPLYLLEDIGLGNATPAEFSEAIEEGTDVPPAVLQETLAVFSSGSVALLAYNDQTAGPETEEVRTAAEAADVPVVDFTETLPDGEDYLGWMTANLDAIDVALG